MLEIFPTGEFNITRINKHGIWFQSGSSEICIPHELIALNSCIRCKHFNFNNKEANTCKAFRDEIPKEIFLGKNDHIKPYPGDNGIQFEPIKEDNANRNPRR